MQSFPFLNYILTTSRFIFKLTGVGFRESTYRTALFNEMSIMKYNYQIKNLHNEVMLPHYINDEIVPCGYIIPDISLETYEFKLYPIEIKAVNSLNQIHLNQISGYVKVTQTNGLIINFNQKTNEIEYKVINK